MQVRNGAGHGGGHGGARPQAAAVGDRRTDEQLHLGVGIAYGLECGVQTGDDGTHRLRSGLRGAGEQLALDPGLLMRGPADIGLDSEAVQRHGDGRGAVDDRVFAEEDRLRMGEALRGALGRRRRFGLRGIVHAEGFRSLWIDFTIICRTPVHPEDEVTSVSGEPY